MLNKFDEILLASPENDMSFPILTFKGTVLKLDMELIIQFIIMLIELKKKDQDLIVLDKMIQEII